MALQVRLLSDRIVVEPDPTEKKTPGGIIIPDSAQKKPLKGKIMAAGKGTKDEPINVKVGDYVLYGQYAGVEVELEGNDYLLMHETDLFLIFI